MKARTAKEPLLRLTEQGWKRLAFALLAALVVMILILAVFPALDGGKPAEVTTYAMGSYVQQTVYGDGAQDAAVAAAAAVQSLENQLSWRVENSDIQRLNAHAGDDWIGLSESAMELLALAKDVNEKSSGAFDITIAPISWLWDFDNSRNEVPAAETIENLLPNVGSGFLRLDMEESTASLRNHANAVDLGALGKGAACDAAVAAYETAGVQAAVVAVGGSVGVYGKKPSGGNWNIAVRDPAGDGSLGTISVAGGFVSTSGSYEKYFEEDGVLYHHIIDPKTGYPAESGLVSVTVWSESGALSDMLSTACFVLGYENSLALLREYSAEAIFITGTKEVFCTVGMQQKFTLTGSGYTLKS